MSQTESKSPKMIDLIYVILKCIYAIIWLIFGFLLFFFFVFGNQIFVFVLGKYANAYILIIGLICCLVPIFLKPLKKRWIRYLIAYGVLASSIISYTQISKNITNYVSVFTVEKWQDHSYFRNYMIDDLVENHGIIGMDRENVIALLGHPDLENETRFSYFVDKDKREFMYIEVLFKDGLVLSIEFIYLL